MWLLGWAGTRRTAVADDAVIKSNTVAGAVRSKAVVPGGWTGDFAAWLRRWHTYTEPVLTLTKATPRWFSMILYALEFINECMKQWWTVRSKS